MKLQRQMRVPLSILGILYLTTIAKSLEVHQDISPNHQESAVHSDSSSLKLEARGDSDGLDIGGVIEAKSKASAVHDKSDKQPMILGATSKVAIVYSEKKLSSLDKDKNIKAPRVVYPLKPNSSADRNWRGVRVSSRDSYLDALEHSKTSKDPREGVISSIDTKPKVSKPIRRDYSEGPVYRHPNDDHYSGSKEPASTFVPYDSGNRFAATKNLVRMSYDGPTPEPFFPTPSDSYTLPTQSSTSFNDNHGYYGAPQASYGAPHTEVYGTPSSNYNRLQPSPQNSYGPPPSNNYYPPAGQPQQAYGPPPPSSSYGVPHAIQDYSQHLPSMMPSIDFSWPFALKLNAFTLAKILLKLVIFKLIVKFIAVICLLLFIPKLEITKNTGSNDSDDSDDDDDGRSFVRKDYGLERLNNLTAFVTNSIENYEELNKAPGKTHEDCTALVCRVKKALSHRESWQDYRRLFENYLAEERKPNNDDRGAQTNRLDS